MGIEEELTSPFVGRSKRAALRVGAALSATTAPHPKCLRFAPTFRPPYNGGGERVVAIAREWIGTPYVHQASVKGAGCDCLGLLRGVWRELRGEEPEAMPPYSPDWAEATGVETMYLALRRHLAEQHRAGRHLPVPHDAARRRETLRHCREQERCGHTDTRARTSA